MRYGTLEQYLKESTERFPERPALIDPSGRACSYRELNQMAEEISELLRGVGVRKGDRVGICMEKSVESVAAVFAVLKCGSAYVPAAPNWPLSRTSFVLHDSTVSAVIADDDIYEALSAPPRSFPCAFIIRSGNRFEVVGERVDRTRNRSDQDGDIAYILYTSGSTGQPKGVTLSHRNGVSFVDWCSDLIQPTTEDRFSSHSPLHFDLSILDIFVPIKHGSSIVLFDSALAGDPRSLTRAIGKYHISIWYSTPTALRTMILHGRMEQTNFDNLRTILFAGEVFPVKFLKQLKSYVPHARYFNLYGPTETNVCTYYELPETIPDTQTEPFPIGIPCSHMQYMVLDEADMKVRPGERGELVIRGGGVMVGYWNEAERTERAFFKDKSGELWYRTGDLVWEGDSGILHYAGRTDRMVKRRGNRIELGEIEHCLIGHARIGQAAVVAVTNDFEVRIIAFYSSVPADTITSIRLREFLGEHLPQYMIPDEFIDLPEIPQTSTNKTDYGKLKEEYC